MTRFCDIIRPASMFCAVSQFEGDFTVQAMFETPRAIMILVVRKRDAQITIEFEEDVVGLQRLTGTFDVRRTDDALKYVERYLDEFRAGKRNYNPADVDLLPRATA